MSYENIDNVIERSNKEFINGIEEGIRFSVNYFFKDIIQETIDNLISIKKGDLFGDSIKK